MTWTTPDGLQWLDHPPQCEHAGGRGQGRGAVASVYPPKSPILRVHARCVILPLEMWGPLAGGRLLAAACGTLCPGQCWQLLLCPAGECDVAAPPLRDCPVHTPYISPVCTACVCLLGYAGLRWAHLPPRKHTRCHVRTPHCVCALSLLTPDAAPGAPRVRPRGEPAVCVCVRVCPCVSCSLWLHTPLRHSMDTCACPRVCV